MNRARGRAERPIGFALACSLAALACEPSDIVLANVPVSPDAGDRVNPPCVDRADCDPLSFCAVPGCGLPLGRCERLPIFCDEIFAPVCGCDGVTYWNDCLRRQHAVPGATAGECTASAMRCIVAPPPGQPNKCPDSAVCAQLSPPGGPCGNDPLGSCWVLPAACADTKAGPPVDSCDGALICVDLCAAMRTGRALRPTKPQACGR